MCVDSLPLKCTIALISQSRRNLHISVTFGLLRSEDYQNGALAAVSYNVGAATRIRNDEPAV